MGNNSTLLDPEILQGYSYENIVNGMENKPI